MEYLYGEITVSKDQVTYLELVLAGLRSRARVEKVDGENLFGD